MPNFDEISQSTAEIKLLTISISDRHLSKKPEIYFCTKFR